MKRCGSSVRHQIITSLPRRSGPSRSPWAAKAGQPWPRWPRQKSHDRPHPGVACARSSSAVSVGLGPDDRGAAITTALFSVVDRVLLQPLPFPDGGQLVSIYEARTSGQERTSLVAPVRLEDWNRLNRTFAAIAGSYSENVTDTSGGEPERPRDGTALGAFGMAPSTAGLSRTKRNDSAGRPLRSSARHSWTRRFARDLSVVGKTLTIGGRGHAIVGVMPREFTSAATDVWIPAQFNDWLLNARDARFRRRWPHVSRRHARAGARRSLAGAARARRAAPEDR